MADVYSAVISDSDYWDGTESWAGELSQANRDTKYSTRNFSTLTLWEADRDGNSSSGDNEHAIIIGPWTSADSNLINKAWTSGVVAVFITCPLTLPDGPNLARHDGTYSTSCYRIENGGSSDISHEIPAQLCLNGLQFGKTGSGGSIVPIAALTGGMDISNCIFRGFTGAGRAIDLALMSTGNVDIYNCVTYNEWDYGIYGDAGGGTVEVANCVIETNNHGRGLRDTGATMNVYNCAVFNNTDDFLNVNDTIDYCASDDGDGTNSVSGLTWANEFNDYPNGDFNLTGTSLQTAGTDDPLSGVYSVDIAGDSYVSPWPIGAFAAPVVATGIISPIISRNGIHSTIFGNQIIN
jgi:hypothetical protein